MRDHALRSRGRTGLLTALLLIGALGTSLGAPAPETVGGVAVDLPVEAAAAPPGGEPRLPPPCGSFLFVVEECGDTMTGTLIMTSPANVDFTGGNGVDFPGGLLKGNTQLQYGPNAVCLDGVAIGTCGDITAVTAGSGLLGGGTSGAVTLSADTTVLQSRVTGTCAAGSAIRVISQTGSVTCEGFGGTFWGLTGNAGTVAGTNFLGTTDNVALELKVNGARALRIAPTSGAPNIIGGSSANVITSGVGGTIAGGGSISGFGCPCPNRLSGNDFDTISGGRGNVIGAANGVANTIGGGLTNNITFGGANTIAGGFLNRVSSNQPGTIGGGQQNTVSADWATIAGGAFSTASGTQATVGGGNANTASGTYATVPGGNGNAAVGGSSFAAGQRAKANHQGAFVWSDSCAAADFPSTAINQFRARACGGVQFLTNSALTNGCTLAPGGGAWSCVSDRATKENFAPVDVREVLAKVGGLPLTTWSYKDEASGALHMGPMAQDFRAAFGLGDSERTIGLMDESGVALAAIQGLYQENLAKDARIASLEARLAALEAALGVHS